MCIHLFRERLSEKVHPTAPKGIVGGFEAVFFKEIRKNCTRGHGRLFASAKESKKKKRRFDSYIVRNSVLIISHITFRDCRVHISSDNLSQNSCILKPFLSNMFGVLNDENRQRVKIYTRQQIFFFALMEVYLVFGISILRAI